MSNDQRKELVHFDASHLTDDEIAEVVGRLTLLGRAVAGTEGTPSSAALAGLVPARRWLYESLRAVFDAVVAENNRRNAADGVALIGEIESWLAGDPDDA